jgi:hypothetical protein
VVAERAGAVAVIFGDWTLALGSASQDATFANPQVSVTIDGAPAAVSAVRSLGGSYGGAETLSWQVAAASGSWRRRPSAAGPSPAIAGCSTAARSATRATRRTRQPA